jgi:hypothetical protein
MGKRTLAVATLEQTAKKGIIHLICIVLDQS